jgi:uncharacterized protein
MNFTESAIKFSCEGETLYGIAAVPDYPVSEGVIIVVGGPQYRIGSHRQFTLIARQLAETGIPVFRFDYRGMGDSTGDLRGYEDVQADIAAALDAFQLGCPTVSRVTIWGLCDGASAAMAYAASDRRVTGLVLINPWMPTNGGKSRTLLRHYYWQRLLDTSFWQKLRSGQFDWRGSLRSVIATTRHAAGDDRGKRAAKLNVPVNSTPTTDRILAAFSRYQGKILLILCRKDLTALEFDGLLQRSRSWRAIFSRAGSAQRDLPDANHTFSRKEWRDQVVTWTTEWIHSKGNVS